MGNFQEAARRFFHEVAWDCLSARHHSRTFDYYRADRLILRSRFFALLLGVATPLWLFADLWLLPAGYLEPMIILRLGAGALLLALAWVVPRPNLAGTRAHILALVGIPLLFHVASQGLLGPTYANPALIGYTTLPLFLVVMLALFPLTFLERVGITALLLGAVVIQHAAQGVVTELGVLGLFWDLALLAGFSLLAQGIHLHMLMLVHRQATHDPLTGLLNRGGLFRRLEQGISQAEWPETATVLIIDLDRFKTINDRHGHPVGDEVLRHLSGILEENLGPNDLAGRIGGEEFVIVSHATGETSARERAEALRRAIADHPASTSVGPLAITASIGIGRWRAGQRVEEVIAEADEALYAAKEGGRNLVVEPGA
ncbi:MAG: GGDEF domain-containing protein [Thiohalospira sp.]